MFSAKIVIKKLTPVFAYSSYGMQGEKTMQ